MKDENYRRSNAKAIDVYLGSAKRLGFDVKVYKDDINFFGEISNDKYVLRMINNVLALNNFIQSKIAKDKLYTNAILSEGIPQYVPRVKEVSIKASSDGLDDLAKDIFETMQTSDFKVMKPYNGANGVGVTVNPVNSEEIKNSIQEILKKYPKTKKVMLEELIKGKREYRVILWKGRVVNCIQRMPANVTGDGDHTIEELIALKNETKAERKRIVIDENLIQNLNFKNLKLNSVLEDGDHVYLRKSCNFSIGGDLLKIENDKLHESYGPLFKKITEITGLNWIGLDLMTDDITAELNSNTGINEVNFSPGSGMVYYADQQTFNDPYKSITEFLKIVFEEGEGILMNKY